LIPTHGSCVSSSKVFGIFQLYFSCKIFDVR
jgi:hypothetical protein